MKYGSSDGIRQKFTTYQRDEETLLDFAEARMYENRHARFTAVDPLLASGKSANPQTFNRYVYVGNNPIIITDIDIANPQTFNRYVYVGNNPIIITDPLGLDWYFNQGENRYDWYDEKTGNFKYSNSDYKINWNNWEIVKGGASAFKYYDNAANNGTYVALDRFSSNFITGLSESMASVKAGGWYNSDPRLRDLSSGIDQGVDDALTGLGRGTLNFGINTWNSTTESPLLTLLNGGINPLYVQPYSYGNARQYSYGSAAEIGLPLGLGFAGATIFSSGSVPSITSEFNNLYRAQRARDAVMLQKGKSHATYIGYENNGRVVAGHSDILGCAEDNVVRQLGSGGNFTAPARFRLNKVTGKPDWQEVPVCVRCQNKYSPGQFPEGTSAKPGGEWGW